MATIASGSIEQLLGAKADYLLGFEQSQDFQGSAAFAGARFGRPLFAGSDRNNRVLVNLQRIIGHGRLADTGYVSILPVDQGIEHSAGASFAKNPDYFDPREHRQAGDRRRLQRRGVDLRRAGLGGAQVRAQDSVHRQDQPQRAADLSESCRPDHVRHREAGLRHGRGGRRRDDLFRLATKARGRSSKSRQAFARAHELGMATVLWCYLRNPAFKTGQGLSRLGRPHRAGESPGRDDSGRHHQAEAAREQRRLQGAEHRRFDRTASSTSASTPSCRAIIRSICAATRWSTATWAASD